MNLTLLTARSKEPLPDFTGATARVLGASFIGLPSVDSVAGWPVQTIAAPLLGGVGDSLQEIWRLDIESRAGTSEGIAFRRAGPLLYGVIELDEAVFSNAPSPLQAATEEAYRRIFRLLEQEGFTASLACVELPRRDQS